MSSPNPPGGARNLPEGGSEQWRRERATARRGRRDEPPEPDAYGRPGPPVDPGRTPFPASGPRGRDPRGAEPEPRPMDDDLDRAWAGQPGSGWSDTGTGEQDAAGDDDSGRPHRRRAAAGQKTGLAPSMQSDLPSWLQERSEGVAPVRRLLSVSVAGFAALLGFGLVLGAHTVPGSYGFVIFGAQVLFVLSWTMGMRPAGARIVAAVGLAAAVAADLAAVLPQTASVAPLALITVGGLIAGVVGQLLRGASRQRATESLGATLIMVIGVVSYATLIVLNRHPGGTESIVVCLAAAGSAIVVARLLDVVMTAPRISTQVPRGTIGVVFGAMVGTVVAGFLGGRVDGWSSSHTVVAGLVTATAAVLVDLAVSYLEVGREMEEEQSSLWVARHMEGPLGAFALASSAAYVLSVMVLVPNL